MKNPFSVPTCMEKASYRFFLCSEKLAQSAVAVFLYWEPILVSSVAWDFVKQFRKDYNFNLLHLNLLHAV